MSWKLFITGTLAGVITRPLIHDNTLYFLSAIPMGIIIFAADRLFKLGLTK